MTARFEASQIAIVVPPGQWQVIQETRKFPTEGNPGSLEANRSIWLFRSGSSDGSDLDYRQVSHDATVVNIEAAPVQFFPGSLQTTIHDLSSGVPLVSPSLKQAVQSTDGYLWFLWTVASLTEPTKAVAVLWDGEDFSGAKVVAEAEAGQEVLGVALDALDNGSVICSFVTTETAGGFNAGSVYYRILTAENFLAGTFPSHVRLGGADNFLLPAPGHNDEKSTHAYGSFLIGQRPGPSWYMTWGVAGNTETRWYVTEASDLTALLSSDTYEAASLPEVASLQESGVTHLQGYDHVWVGHTLVEKALVASSTLGIRAWCPPSFLGTGTGPHVTVLSRELPAAAGVFTAISFDSCLNGAVGYFTGSTASFGNVPEYACNPCQEEQELPLSIYRTNLTAFHKGLVPSKASTKKRC